MGHVAPAAGVQVALSTASVFPERTPDAFETAARLGYDGVEVMVTMDPVSQDLDIRAGSPITTASRSWPCTHRA